MRSFSMRTNSSSIPRPDNTCWIAVRASPAPSIFGSCGRYPKPPRRITEPAAGSAAPPSTRNSDVLPAPLRPTMPTLSRGMTVKLAPSTTSRPPTSTESACAWSIRSDYGRGAMTATVTSAERTWLDGLARRPGRLRVLRMVAGAAYVAAENPFRRRGVHPMSVPSADRLVVPRMRDDPGDPSPSARQRRRRRCSTTCSSS